jgi:hypothetical protein
LSSSKSARTSTLEGAHERVGAAASVPPSVPPPLEPELAPLLEPGPLPLLEPELAPLLDSELPPLLEPELPLDPELPPELEPLLDPELPPSSSPKEVPDELLLLPQAMKRDEDRSAAVPSEPRVEIERRMRDELRGEKGPEKQGCDDHPVGVSSRSPCFPEAVASNSAIGRGKDWRAHPCSSREHPYRTGVTVPPA